MGNFTDELIKLLTLKSVKSTNTLNPPNSLEEKYNSFKTGV